MLSGKQETASTERRLAEREKELACIYSICLLAASGAEPDIVAEGVAGALRAAMQCGESALCAVEFLNPATGKEVRVRQGGEAPERRPERPAGGAGQDAGVAGQDVRRGGPVPPIEAFLPADMNSGGWRGSIRLEYPDGSPGFLPQEKALLESVAIVAASILRTSSLIESLRAASANLTAKNIALREVLSAIEDERRTAVNTFRKRLSAGMLPLAERARDPSLTTEKRHAYLDLLVDEIGREISTFGPNPATHDSLSPREREIAVQVRNGRTSKEIGELLGIAEATVERHRHNIRRKLKIANQPINLAGLLSNEDSAENR